MMSAADASAAAVVLHKHRDAFLPTYTYWWEKGRSRISPYFSTVTEAEQWLADQPQPESSQNP